LFLSLSCLSNDIAFKCNASVTITKDADKTLNYYECNKPSISTPHLPSIEPPQTTFEPPTIHEVTGDHPLLTDDVIVDVIFKDLQDK
jgi:hypothetical protein